jgi:hypothetical protein
MSALDYVDHVSSESFVFACAVLFVAVAALDRLLSRRL